jgi:hypothetical protein
MFENESVTVEWVILADAAQVVGNKLYLLGGGWDVLTVQGSLPVDQPVAIALSFRVPWNATNERHPFEFEVVTEDGRAVLKGGGELEVGRRPGIVPGTVQRIQMALSGIAKIAQPGTYTIVGRIKGNEAKTSFLVVHRPGLSGRQAA